MLDENRTNLTKEVHEGWCGITVVRVIPHSSIVFPNATDIPYSNTE